MPIKLPHESTLFLLRRQSALNKKNPTVKPEHLTKVRCEACRDVIRNYFGDPNGILCDRCLNVNLDELSCTRIKPLVILNSNSG